MLSRGWKEEGVMISLPVLSWTTPPPPQRFAGRAGGMHPTGMHSCCLLNSPLLSADVIYG